MDDPQNIPDPNLLEETIDPRDGHEPKLPAELIAELTAAIVPQHEPAEEERRAVSSYPLAETVPHDVIPSEARNLSAIESQEKRDSSARSVPRNESVLRVSANGSENAASRRRSFRHNLFLLLSLALAAFILTAWILVRVDAPFGIFSTGPQEIVRAQLRALDRGELRPAYDMFSARYRGQVSFDTWHELFVKHWRMFHADVVRAEPPAISGPGVTLEIYLHGADDKDYRARFTLIRTDGRWWIDDVHWTQEMGARDFSRT
jgi:hypothetical protein